MSTFNYSITTDYKMSVVQELLNSNKLNNERKKTMLNKTQKRLNEIKKILEDNYFNTLDMDLIKERNDLEFKLNKENINFRLTCNNKYYYANQCKIFTNHIMENGFPYKDIKRIKEDGITFNKYSINIGYNQHCEDLKRFNSKDELLGFVIGYNSANGLN